MNTNRFQAGDETRDDHFIPVADKDWSYAPDDNLNAADCQAERDAFVYRNLVATMRDLMELGDAGSPEFMECWAEAERIKSTMDSPHSRERGRIETKGTNE
jgi:hypothetical protein